MKKIIRNLMRHGQLSSPYGIRTPPTHVPTTLPPPELLNPTSLHSNENQRALCVRHLHDPIQLAALWADPSNAQNFTWRRDVRHFVQIGTIMVILRGRYILPDGQQVDCATSRRAREKMVKEVVYIPSAAGNPVTPQPIHESRCLVYVLNVDCLDATIALVDEGLRPVCLVLASASHPGGAYRQGAGAQEENICRRSNLWEVLEDPYQLDPEREWSYPVPEFGGIYVPRLRVIRGTEKNGYPFLEKPYEIATLNAYAYHDPPLEDGRTKGELRLPSNIVKLYRKKIDAILRIAVEQRHDSIVLGALGCGAYGTPPRHMAEIFRECLEPYRRCFKKVVFAILEDGNSFKEHNPAGNFAPFQEVFME